jgi:hypothetical protein
MSDDKVLWTRNIVNNAHAIGGGGTPWGIVTWVRQDRDYGGRSYIEMIGTTSGKVLWRKDFPPRTNLYLRGTKCWTAALDGSKVGLLSIGAKGTEEVWSRSVPGGGRVVFEEDRVLVVKDGGSVTVMDRESGKDAIPPLRKLTNFRPGPVVYTGRGRGKVYRQEVVRAFDRRSGKPLWEWFTGPGIAPESTRGQVLAQGGSPIFHYWSRYYRHPSPSTVKSLTSLDTRDGWLLGRIAVPGRDLDSSRLRQFQPNVTEHGGLLVLRTEGGVCVMGAAGVRPPGVIPGQLGEIAAGSRGLSAERRLATLRESLVRYTPPAIGAERCERPPHLDGQFDDWEGAYWTPLARAEDWVPDPGGAMPAAARKWGGAPDCSARFALRHDGETLYAAVEVRDDDFCPPVGVSSITPGDCVELGLSLRAERSDCLGVDHGRYRPDMKIRLALVGGEAVAHRVWYGSGSEAAISVRPGVVRYEAAVPFTGGRLRREGADAMGFSLRVVDADGGQPKGSMRWSGGLRGIGSSARFGTVVLAPFSKREMQEGRRLVDLLPDSALAWDLLYRMAGTHLAGGRADRAHAEFVRFRGKHRDSHLGSRCEVWLNHMGMLAGIKERRALSLPAEEKREAGLRLYARVRMPADRRPRSVALKMNYQAPVRHGLWRGVYWGRRRELLAGDVIYAGPIPNGTDVELSVPAELLGLANKTLLRVQFAQYDGTAWWGDFGVADASGKRTVMIPAAAACKVRGANWKAGKAPDGKPGHWAADLGLGWSTHLFTPGTGRRGGGALPSAALAGKNLELERAGGKLPKDKCIEAANLIPDNRLVVDLLRAVQDGKAVAAFIRKHPRSAQVLSLLEMLARSRSSESRAIPAKLIAEGVLERETSRAYLGRRAGGVRDWQLVGPFTNEADVALRRVYPPEKNASLAAKYTSPEGEIAWRKGSAAADGHLEMSALLEGGDFQAGYAMCWVKAAQRRRAWLYLSTGNVVSLWVGKERVLENVDGGGGRSSRRRTRRALDPVPVTLTPGWNRVLVKCCGRWGAWGYKLYFGDAAGEPLKDLTFSVEEPAAVD